MAEAQAQSSVQITLKLYASLGEKLPAGAKRNQIDIMVPAGASVQQVFRDLNVPEEMCHLVLINGGFVAPSARATTTLKSGDHLAVWPPVAGG